MAIFSHPLSSTTLRSLAISICLLSKMASAQNGDGGAASGNLPGTSSSNGAALGAAGPSQSSANLSIGATIAIAVIVGIAVILGTLTAILFWQAKKRQWTVRETLRHSRRRVTSGIRKVTSPLTPHRTTFARFNDAEDMQKLRPMGSSAAANPPPSFSKRDRETAKNTFQNRQSGQIDLEKGPAPLTMGHSRGPSGVRPKAPMLMIPGSGGKGGNTAVKTTSATGKAERSPDPPQTPMWAKFLGRT